MKQQACRDRTLRQCIKVWQQTMARLYISFKLPHYLQRLYLSSWKMVPVRVWRLSAWQIAITCCHYQHLRLCPRW